MTLPLAKPARAEGLVAGILNAAFAARGETATAGVIVPTEVSWTAATKFVQVLRMPATEVRYPILWRTPVQFTAWAGTTTVAQDLAALAEAILLAYPGSDLVAGFLPLSSGLLAKDPATGAQLASSAVSAKLQGIAFT
ncbi:MAG: hypothetical protein PSX37_08900 [bacterium]|nr:hypothetical protein [bacterium]